MNNRLGYLAGNRPGFSDGTDSDTGPVSGPDTDSLTDSPYVRAIASRPVPSLPIPSGPNPGAIPHNRDQQLNGEQRLSAVDAEVAGVRASRESVLSRPQAIRIARDMHGGGWKQIQIRDYLAGRGVKVHRTTIRRWVDPEYAARYNEAHAADQRRRYRAAHDPKFFRVLDEQAREQLGDDLVIPASALPELTVDLMETLRVEDGLSYTAIAKVAARLYGQTINADQVRYRLVSRGVPKDPAKVRSARNFTRGKAAA